MEAWWYGSLAISRLILSSSTRYLARAHWTESQRGSRDLNKPEPPSSRQAAYEVRTSRRSREPSTYPNVDEDRASLLKSAFSRLSLIGPRTMHVQHSTT